MNFKKLKQIYEINITFNGINSAYADIARKFDLNYNSFMVIYNMEYMEKCTQKNLCDILMVSKSTMHSILVSFVEKGFVELQIDSNNKKERIIIPTADGKVFFNRVCNYAHEIEEAVWKEMNDKNCELYLELSKQYETILKKHIKEKL